jgi:ABC-type arginine transport system permease subunit
MITFLIAKVRNIVQTFVKECSLVEIVGRSDGMKVTAVANIDVAKANLCGGGLGVAEETYLWHT